MALNLPPSGMNLTSFLAMDGAVLRVPVVSPHDGR
jgi:hypothetical protein